MKKVSAPATVRTEVPAGLDDLVETFVTPARIEQILSETFPGESPDVSGTGRFIRAMAEDVLKESAEERSAAGLDETAVRKAVERAARSVFLDLIATPDTLSP